MQYDQKQIYDLNVNYVTLAGMIKRRASISQAHWNKEFNLEKVRKENKELYTTEYVKKWLIDERYQEIFADNRLFVATRTLVSFISSRISEPEVIPADGKDLSLQFARDFEKILLEEADEVNALAKVKLAVQDLLAGQRVGVLKWVYNDKKKCLELQHLDPASVIIGKKAKLHEEPDFVQEKQKRTVGDLLKLFPDKKDTIFRLFNIQKGVPSQLEREVDITENWIWLTDDNGDEKLGCAWGYQNTVFGAMSDPCWNPDGENILNNPTVPYIFINFLNDGSGYIDHTSFIEQAKYSQKNYDKRGMTIEENAAYAGVGVPVFGKGAVTEETAARVRFSPTQRIMLDIEDVGKGFTTWKGGDMPQFVVEDKMDLRANVDNIYGTNSLVNGQNAESKTLGQDVLLRDQAQGRQQELVDCVEVSMARFYQLLGQFVYRYFDEEKYYNFLGENGQFESIILNQSKVKDNLDIRIMIKAGTSLPIDRAQKRQVALELLKSDRISTLRLYKELGLEKPDEAYHEFLQEKLLPFASMAEADKSADSREAEADLAVVIGGKVPEEREDIDQDYLTYLNEYVLTNKYHQLPQAAQQRVSLFVTEVIAQAQRKALKLQTQSDVPQDPNKMMPPVRAKLSLSGKDLQPDVLAQAVEAIGYQPSVLTQAEMAAGIIAPPRENMNMKPLNPAQAAPAGNSSKP